MRVTRHDHPLAKPFSFIAGHIYQNLASSDERIYLFSENVEPVLVDIESGHAMRLSSLEDWNNWMDVTDHYSLTPNYTSIAS